MFNSKHVNIPKAQIRPEAKRTLHVKQDTIRLAE
jgi:hypothetical protein